MSPSPTAFAGLNAVAEDPDHGVKPRAPRKHSASVTELRTSSGNQTLTNQRRRHSITGPPTMTWRKQDSVMDADFGNHRKQSTISLAQLPPVDCYPKAGTVLNPFLQYVTKNTLAHNDSRAHEDTSLVHNRSDSKGLSPSKFSRREIVRIATSVLSFTSKIPKCTRQLEALKTSPNLSCTGCFRNFHAAKNPPMQLPSDIMNSEFSSNQSAVATILIRHLFETSGGPESLLKCNLLVQSLIPHVFPGVLAQLFLYSSQSDELVTFARPRQQSCPFPPPDENFGNKQHHRNISHDRQRRPLKTKNDPLSNPITKIHPPPIRVDKPKMRDQNSYSPTYQDQNDMAHRSGWPSIPLSTGSSEDVALGSGPVMVPHAWHAGQMYRFSRRRSHIGRIFQVLQRQASIQAACMEPSESIGWPACCLQGHIEVTLGSGNPVIDLNSYGLPKGNGKKIAPSATTNGSEDDGRRQINEHAEEGTKDRFIDELFIVNPSNSGENGLCIHNNSNSAQRSPWPCVHQSLQGSFMSHPDILLHQLLFTSEIGDSTAAENLCKLVNAKRSDLDVVWKKVAEKNQSSRPGASGPAKNVKPSGVQVARDPTPEDEVTPSDQALLSANANSKPRSSVNCYWGSHPSLSEASVRTFGELKKFSEAIDKRTAISRKRSNSGMTGGFPAEDPSSIIGSGKRPNFGDEHLLNHNNWENSPRGYYNQSECLPSGNPMAHPVRRRSSLAMNFGKEFRYVKRSPSTFFGTSRRNEDEPKVCTVPSSNRMTCKVANLPCEYIVLRWPEDPRQILGMLCLINTNPISQPNISPDNIQQDSPISSSQENERVDPGELSSSIKTTGSDSEFHSLGLEDGINQVQSADSITPELIGNEVVKCLSLEKRTLEFSFRDQLVADLEGVVKSAMRVEGLKKEFVVRERIKLTQQVSKEARDPSKMFVQFDNLLSTYLRSRLVVVFAMDNVSREFIRVWNHHSLPDRLPLALPLSHPQLWPVVSKNCDSSLVIFSWVEFWACRKNSLPIRADSRNLQPGLSANRRFSCWASADLSADVPGGGGDGARTVRKLLSQDSSKVQAILDAKTPAAVARDRWDRRSHSAVTVASEDRNNNRIINIIEKPTQSNDEPAGRFGFMDPQNADRKPRVLTVLRDSESSSVLVLVIDAIGSNDIPNSSSFKVKGHDTPVTTVPLSSVPLGVHVQNTSGTTTELLSPLTSQNWDAHDVPGSHNVNSNSSIPRFTAGELGEDFLTPVGPCLVEWEFAHQFSQENMTFYSQAASILAKELSPFLQRFLIRNLMNVSKRREFAPSSHSIIEFVLAPSETNGTDSAFQSAKQMASSNYAVPSKLVNRVVNPSSVKKTSADIDDPTGDIGIFSFSSKNSAAKLPGSTKKPSRERSILFQSNSQTGLPLDSIPSHTISTSRLPDCQVLDSEPSWPRSWLSSAPTQLSSPALVSYDPVESPTLSVTGRQFEIQKFKSCGTPVFHSRQPTSETLHEVMLTDRRNSYLARRMRISNIRRQSLIGSSGRGSFRVKKIRSAASIHKEKSTITAPTNNPREISDQDKQSFLDKWTSWEIDWWSVKQNALDDFLMTASALIPADFDCDRVQFAMRRRQYFTFIGQKYRDVPYHNVYHAAQAFHCVWFLLYYHHLRHRILPLESQALLLAAFSHDVDHPGVSNAFLINTNHALAVRYNDQSVLEHHHAAFSFKAMRDRPEIDVFCSLHSKSDAALFRKTMILAILATDMQQHSGVISGFTDMCSALQNDGMANGDLILEPEGRRKLIQIIMHGADLSNPLTPFPYFRRWAALCTEEFNAQVDKEMQLGIEITSFMNCRSEKSRVETQLGFVEFVVLPTWRPLASFQPSIQNLIDMGLQNSSFWRTCLKILEAAEEKAQKEKESGLEPSSLTEKAVCLNRLLKSFPTIRRLRTVVDKPVGFNTYRTLKDRSNHTTEDELDGVPRARTSSGMIFGFDPNVAGGSKKVQWGGRVEDRKRRRVSTKGLWEEIIRESQVLENMTFSGTDKHQDESEDENNDMEDTAQASFSDNEDDHDQGRPRKNSSSIIIQNKNDFWVSRMSIGPRRARGISGEWLSKASSHSHAPKPLVGTDHSSSKGSRKSRRRRSLIGHTDLSCRVIETFNERDDCGSKHLPGDHQRLRMRQSISSNFSEHPSAFATTSDSDEENSDDEVEICSYADLLMEYDEELLSLDCELERLEKKKKKRSQNLMGLAVFECESSASLMDPDSDGTGMHQSNEDGSTKRQRGDSADSSTKYLKRVKKRSEAYIKAWNPSVISNFMFHSGAFKIPRARD